jgi:hypothetical protein
MMGVDWVYVINDGSGTPNVKRKSRAGITVVQDQTGVYTVTFPESGSGLTCVATLNSSVGAITAVPGDAADKPANTVRILTADLNNNAMSSYHFSLVVFYNTRQAIGSAAPPPTQRTKKSKQKTKKYLHMISRRRNLKHVHV